MEEPIDLTNAKWSAENEIYLMCIAEGIKDNYPHINLDDELKESGYVLEDFFDSSKIASFMKNLSNKYPD